MDSLKLKAGVGRSWTREEALQIIQEFRTLVQDIPEIRKRPERISAAVDRLGELRAIITEMQDQGVT